MSHSDSWQGLLSWGGMTRAPLQFTIIYATMPVRRNAIADCSSVGAWQSDSAMQSPTMVTVCEIVVMKTASILILPAVLLVAGCTGGTQPSGADSTNEQTAVATASQDGDASPNEAAVPQKTETPPADEPSPEPKDTPVDRTDAAATAVAVLTAYQQKHLAELATLCTTGNRDIFVELADQGEKHPRYRSIFSGWRWESLANWDGQIGEVKYRNDKTAVVKFGEIGAKEVAVVVLEWADNIWCFEDINSPNKSNFESLKNTRQ